MTQFEELYKQEYTKLFSAAYKIIEDEDISKDIVQEVFISFYEKTVSNKKLVNHPHSWLMRAVLNKCIDRIERNKKRTELTLVTTIQETEEENIDKEQRHQLLRHAMQKLSKQEMKLLVLYSENYSYKEMAETLNMNFASVGKTLSRTLQKLKIILRQMNYEQY